MNIFIIGSTQFALTPRDREYYQEYVRFFSKSAQAGGVEAQVFTAQLSDLIVSVGDGTMEAYDTFNQRDLASYDVFFFRGGGFRPLMDVIATITQFAVERGIPSINDYSDIRDSSKLYQATRFHKIGVPVARTIAVNQTTIDHFDKIKDFTFPAILKARLGAHGNDNYLVKDLDEVRRILAETPTKQFVLQRFVPNEGDFRILIIGDQTMVIGREAVAGSHLNNTSKGGTATEVELDEVSPQIIEQAHIIAKEFGMTIAGVDVLKDKNTGEHFFLEVNSQPQIMTGAFLDKKVQMLGALIAKLRDSRHES
jgi:glutathione synthase/RimK-type ligase-like ATP-grasp enzyme